MIRGIYTGASGMAARIHEMDVVANNLANVNTTGFKKDLAILKAFPEMTIRRQSDEAVITLPSLGSYDKRPVVGKLGTGVEINEVYNQKEQGSLRQTENNFDFALQGHGYFVVDTPNGERYTRNGAFTLNNNYELVTMEGHKVLGEKGIIRFKNNNFIVNAQGEIFSNKEFNNPANRPVQLRENGYENPELLNKLRVVDFQQPRHLVKEGSSFYRANQLSGQAERVEDLYISNYDGVEIPRNPLPVKVIQGFLENSNVNPVNEMVKMIEVQRAYEASQKSITTGDETLNRLINNMARIT